MAALTAERRRRPGREDSERNWTVPRADIEAKHFDLMAVKPHAKKMRARACRTNCWT